MRLTHRLAELEARGDVNAFSFGCFLPDSEVGIQRLKARLEALCQLEPAFISISGLGNLEYAAACIPLAQHVAKVMGIPAILHISLPPVAPAAELLQTLELLKAHGLRNVVLSELGVPAADADATTGASTDGVTARASASAHVSEIKRAFGDYFCLGLAAVASIPHVAQLKAAQDTGIEFVVLQHSYDSKGLLRHGEEAFRAGVTVPLIPSLLMHGSRQTLLQINEACRVSLPADLRALAAAPPDAATGGAADELTLRDRVNAVLLAEAASLYTCGARVLHLLTLNLEGPARRLLRDLGLVGPGAPSRRRLPWRPSADEARAFEDVRPIFWANRPASYVERTSSWETFPSGRWQSSCGDLERRCFESVPQTALAPPREVSAEERRALWGAPANYQDVWEVFAGYIEGRVARLPWCEVPLHAETTPLSLKLSRLNREGFLTINSQPRVNGARSDDPVHGWGGPGGYCYQKAYIECFADSAHLAALMEVALRHPSIVFQAVDVHGNSYSNCKSRAAQAVTWGVFPAREILQPTVVDPDAFLEWKTEAFALWLTHWASVYDEDSASADLLHELHGSYFLVNVVDHDFVGGDIFAVFEEAAARVARKAAASSGGAAGTGAVASSTGSGGSGAVSGGVGGTAGSSAAGSSGAGGSNATPAWAVLPPPVAAGVLKR